MKGKMVGNLTFRDFGVDEEEVKKVRAELKFAVNLGLIMDDSCRKQKACQGSGNHFRLR